MQKRIYQCKNVMKIESTLVYILFIIKKNVVLSLSKKRISQIFKGCFY